MSASHCLLSQVRLHPWNPTVWSLLKIKLARTHTTKTLLIQSQKARGDVCFSPLQFQASLTLTRIEAEGFKRSNFVGCVKNLEANSDLKPFPKPRRFGDVILTLLLTGTVLVPKLASSSSPPALPRSMPYTISDRDTSRCSSYSNVWIWLRKM